MSYGLQEFVNNLRAVVSASTAEAAALAGLEAELGSLRRASLALRMRSRWDRGSRY